MTDPAKKKTSYDYLSLGVSGSGTLVALLAAIFSYEASENAAKSQKQLEDLKIDLDTRKFSVQIFQASLPYFEKLNAEDDSAARYCKIVVQLAET